MDKVSIERAYRIIKALEDFAKDIKDIKIPMLQEALSEWSRKVLYTDIFIFIIMLILVGAIEFQTGVLNMLSSGMGLVFAGLGFVFVLAVSHFKVRSFFANKIAKKYLTIDTEISKAILSNTQWWKKSFGFGLNWNKNIKNKLDDLMEDGRKAIQKLNDQFVNMKPEDKRD